MNYLDKCVSKEDLLLNKLEQGSNLIVFILKPDLYFAYTVSDLKKLIENKQNHYIEGSDKLESFVELSIKIVADSSLQKAFINKNNTLKLVKTGKFRMGFEGNKQILSYYSVEVVSRKEIGSDEFSFFKEEKKEDRKEKETKEDDSHFQIDWTKVRKLEIERMKIQAKRLEQENKRLKKEVERLKLKNKQNGTWKEIIKYESNTEYIREFEKFILTKEKWLKNGKIHRDNDLPAVIDYYDGIKEKEIWYQDGVIKRGNEDDLPAVIDYDVNDEKECEKWYKNGKIHRDNDLPAYIIYSKHKIEYWYQNGSRCRDDDKPAIIVYYENGNTEREYWYKNGLQSRDYGLPSSIYYFENGSISAKSWENTNRNGKPYCICYSENGNISCEKYGSIVNQHNVYYDEQGAKEKETFENAFGLFKIIRYINGLKADETWYKNKKIHRDGDEPAWISYYNGSTQVYILRWYIDGKTHRENEKPAQIKFFEKGNKKEEKWFKNDVCIRTLSCDDLDYTNDLLCTGEEV